MAEQIPGQVIDPNSGGGQDDNQPPAAPVSPIPEPPIETQPPQPPTPVRPIEQPTTSYETPGAYQNTAETRSDGSVTWTASEYIGHEKSFAWYAALLAVTCIVAIGVYFVTSKDIMSVVVVVIAAFIFGVYAARPPKTQQYNISEQGIAIGPKVYPYSDLKSFSIIDEGVFASITFMPMKRFMPALSIYFAPNDEEKIVNALSAYLPVEESRRDPIDRLMRKIRF